MYFFVVTFVTVFIRICHIFLCAQWQTSTKHAMTAVIYSVTYVLWCGRCCVISEQSCQEIWQWRLCSSSHGRECINHWCQPLTLCVWSLGRTCMMIRGNELLEADSIIHTYKIAPCPLFLEIRLNEGGPYLGSVLMVSSTSTLHSQWSASPVPVWLDSWAVTVFAH